MHTAFRTFAAISFSMLAMAALPAQAREDTPSVPMISGGVGDDDYDFAHSAKDGYNVRVLLTETNGAYLSDVSVTISKPGGTVIATTVTQGPVLFIKLAAGEYSIKASVAGLTKNQKVTVAGKGRTNAHIAFPIKDNID